MKTYSFISVVEPLLDTIRETVQSWKPDVAQRALSWSHFPKGKGHTDYGGVGGPFLKYNTPLPSSAAVERMFCIGGDILRGKRSRLAGRRFEELVFLKGNLKLLGYDSL